MVSDTREAPRLTSSRIDYFDFLRIFAAIAVVAVHVTAQNWGKVEVRSYQWQIFCLWNGLSRWAVPVFVMISGALFLDGNQSLRRICTKNVLRIVTAFLFWSAVYAVTEAAEKGWGVKKTILEFISGTEHLWFLHLIAGLYLVVPILKQVVRSEKVTKYFLALAFLFRCVLPQFITCTDELSAPLGEALRAVMNHIQIGTVMGYGFFFVLGYYLNKTDFSGKWRRVIYILGICGAVATVGLTSAASVWKNAPTEIFLVDTDVNVVCMSVAVFVFAREHFSCAGRGERTVRLIRKLSKYSFGVYLAHILVIRQLKALFGIHTLWLSPVVSVPLIVVLVTAVSFLITGVLSRIPFLKKYIV